MKTVFTIWLLVAGFLQADLAYAELGPIPLNDGEAAIKNVFIPREEITVEGLAARGLELESDLTMLTRLEQHYVFSHDEIALKASPDEIREMLNRFIEELSPDDRAKLESSHPDLLSANASGKYQEILTRLDTWFAAQSLHHGFIDRLNMEKFNYFVKQARYYSDVSFLQLKADRPNLSEKAERKLLEAHDALIASHQEYLANLDKYGTPKDTFRLAAIRDVFAATKSYFDALQRITLTPLEKFAKLRRKVAAFPKKFWENLKLLALAPDAIKLGADIVFRDGGKINNSVNDIFLKGAALKGYNVEIKGMENLRIATTHRQEKTINIIAKVHRGPVLDNMVLAHLNLKDYVFVTSFGSIIPKFFSDRLVNNPGIAFVGPGFPGGVETLVNKAINNPENIMVNYAEGSIGNMGETRPIAVKFSTAVIPALRKEGYKVNVIPVTSQAASFLKKDVGPELLFGKIIGARVHAPITDSMITLLESSGRLDKLGIYIRSTWLSELETDTDQAGNLIEGSLSLRGMEKMLFKYLNVHYAQIPFCNVDLLQK